ncbi:hypothetical protein H2202_002926 [Exophiala xenobiotica]|nr:hypothetical protein H2202_002926 [Exophiala xenobiotica]
MKAELTSVKDGTPEDFGSFTGPVINQAALHKINKAIDTSNEDSRLKLVIGGKYGSSLGLFIEPTLYANHPLFEREVFDPVLVAWVNYDAEVDSVLVNIDQKGGGFALTSAKFANNIAATRKA